MYAIVEVGGRQHMMTPDQTVKVDRRPQETGEEIVLDRVLAIKDADGELRVGRPYLDDASVTARVIQQGRERKITVVKFKAKKRYRRKVGHRQHFTALEIISINADGEPLEMPEVEAPETEEPEVEAQEPKAGAQELEVEAQEPEAEAAAEEPDTEVAAEEAEVEAREAEADVEDEQVEQADDSSETGDDTDGS